MTREVAALIGGIVSAFVSAITVILAFARPALRFALARWRGSFISVSDQLMAGIWLSTLGAAVIMALGLVRLLFDIFLPGVLVLPWIMVATGYVLIFAAWRSSYLGKKDRFLVPWLVALLAIGGVAALGAVILATAY